ncbi:MAG: Flp pilus assembly complex ATPase component TadA [Magnetococcales bacterium]|nr:Flp pilus assembly complex ATPase component TadA [Magnetococcales bacterium]
MDTSTREKSEEMPQETAPSDLALAIRPRYAPLIEALTQEGVLSSRRLAQLLGCDHMVDSTSLLHVFLTAGLVTTEAVQQAKEGKKNTAGTPLWKLLVERGMIGERAMAMGLAVSLNLPYTELDQQLMDPAAVQRMDGRNAALWGAIPVRLEDNNLLMACSDPRLVDAERACQLSGLRVQLCLAPASVIQTAIDNWYGDEARMEVNQPIGRLDVRGMIPVAAADLNPRQSVTTLFDQLIVNAIAKRASDIHLVPDQRFLHVHFRIDGRLLEEVRLPLHLRNSLISRIKVVAGMDIAEKRLPQDGHIQVRLTDRMLDLRVSDVPSVRGETMVLRLLDLQVGLVPMEKLGFAPEDLERFRRNVALPHGLILVTGPTGSGKSTTLRAALDHIVRHQFCHVLSVEDPVEVRMDGVTQVQINPKIDFTFPRALRQFLRHDPDVIMVGEIRDAETAKISVQAALTGHRVFSTLHTNDAPGAITRLVDMGVEPFLVSSAVSMVVAQRLVRRLCPACRRQRPTTPMEKQLLLAMGVPSATSRRIEFLHVSPGCLQCNHTGHVGRTVIYEMLTVDEEMKQRIAKNEPASILRREAIKRGFQPLVASGLAKVLLGVAALEEVAPYMEPFLENNTPWNGRSDRADELTMPDRSHELS